MSLLNLDNIPENEINGLDPETLYTEDFITRESNKRYLWIKIWINNQYTEEYTGSE